MSENIPPGTPMLRPKRTGRPPPGFQNVVPGQSFLPSGFQNLLPTQSTIPPGFENVVPTQGITRNLNPTSSQQKSVKSKVSTAKSTSKSNLPEKLSPVKSRHRGKTRSKSSSSSASSGIISRPSSNLNVVHPTGEPKSLIEAFPPNLNFEENPNSTVGEYSSDEDTSDKGTFDECPQKLKEIRADLIDILTNLENQDTTNF